MVSHYIHTCKGKLFFQVNYQTSFRCLVQWVRKMLGRTHDNVQSLPIPTTPLPDWLKATLLNTFTDYKWASQTFHPYTHKILGESLGTRLCTSQDVSPSISPVLNALNHVYPERHSSLKVCSSFCVAPYDLWRLALTLFTLTHSLILLYEEYIINDAD